MSRKVGKVAMKVVKSKVPLIRKLTDVNLQEFNKLYPPLDRVVAGSASSPPPPSSSATMGSGACEVQHIARETKAHAGKEKAVKQQEAQGGDAMVVDEKQGKSGTTTLANAAPIKKGTGRRARAPFQLAKKESKKS